MADPKYYGYDRNIAVGAAGRRLCTAIVTLAATAFVIVSIFILRFGSKLPIYIAEEALLSLFGVEVNVESVRPAGILSLAMEDLSIKESAFDLSAHTAVLTIRPSARGVTLTRFVLVDPEINIRVKNDAAGRRELQAFMDRLAHVRVEVTNARVTVEGVNRSMTFIGLTAVHRRFFDVGFITADGIVTTSGDERGLILSGTITARLWMRGMGERRIITGDVAGEGIGYGVGDYLFLGDGFSAPLVLEDDELSITGFGISGFGVQNDARHLSYSGMNARGDLLLFPLPEHPARRGVVFSDVTVFVPNTGEISLELLDVRAGDWEVIARTENAHITPGLMRGLGDVLPGNTETWEWNGVLTGEVQTGHSRDDVGVAGRVDVSYGDLSFSSPEWTYVADGIDGTLEVAWRSNVPGEMESEMLLSAGGFQALIGDVYVDFTDLWVKTSFSGTLTEDSAVEGMEWTVSVPGVVRGEAAGDLSLERRPVSGDLDVRVNVMDPGALFDLAVRDTVASRVPMLADGFVEGSIDVRAHVSGKLSAPRIAGDAAADVARAGFGSDTVEVMGLSVDMPVRLDLSGGAPHDGVPDISPREYGTVSLKGAHLFGVEVGEAAVDAALIDNVFTIHTPLIVPVSGGELVVDELTVIDPLSPGREITAEFEVMEFDLAPLFETVWDVKMTGMLSGGYDDAEVREGRLETTGEMVADIAEGEVSVTNLWGADVFSPRRRIGMDVSFDEISLEKVTESMDVGKVSGVVSGSLDDLIIAYNEPQRFVFDVRTVEKPGVPKRVSVDFVDNISILGSGTDIFTETLNRGVNRFVGEYRYSEMGIHLELEGAYFTVSGTVHDGDTEYFIKRSGPFGINVVNRNPHNSIRFRDMMSRLKRIRVESTEDIVIEK
ncbi:MAG: hypothetical protein JW885_02280 [Deltaproteobacteria bacterium]|nr:hypothetical protein [Candidatus Zymogenaceae bacterium]